ncbi:hypothetical protein GF348_18200 [candidate division KSB3 bacterium]|nr:hypothetical protein [candidate division KSB3 bacterium]
MNIITRGEWFDFFGFRSSPFESQTATQESPEVWIPPPSFERILGNAQEPQSILVFAPRGGGKTACRRLIEYYCSSQVGVGASIEVGGRVLAVPYDNFSEACRRILNGQAVGESWHVGQVLRHALQALITYTHESSAVTERFKQKVEELRPACRQELYAIMNTYRPAWPSQIEDLQKLFPGCTETPSLQNHPGLGEIDHLERFTALVCDSGNRGLGFDALYVLIDSLDSDSNMANLNQDAVLKLILPLITNRRLMSGIQKMAMKCFLPKEIRKRLLKNEAMHNMGIPEADIDWQRQNTGDILCRRLLNYKNDRNNSSFTRIEELCGPGLRAIEDLLFTVAKGNPRSIIRLCDFMVEAHVKRPITSPAPDFEDSYLLNELDWEEAQERFEAELESQKGNSTISNINIYGNGNVIGNGSNSRISKH